MSYARVRLWLGITSVGSLVLLSAILLLTGLPRHQLSVTEQFQIRDIAELAAVFALVWCWMFPFDFLGGYWAPKTYGRGTNLGNRWLTHYLLTASYLFLFYLLSAIGLLTAGRWGGTSWVLLTALGLMWISQRLRRWLLLRREIPNSSHPLRIDRAKQILASWGIKDYPTKIIEHADEGFTGGIISLKGQSWILIPRLWVEKLSPDSLACVLARRGLAIETGAYRRGVLGAYAWNIFGLFLSGLWPGAGFTSVAGLTATFCYFTLWSFVGLLWLPSLSRRGSMALDGLLNFKIQRPELIRETALQLDRWQDNEPDRSEWIERIFHPIPNAAKREGLEQNRNRWIVWNSARLTLAYSWGCVGFLSRAVHCNVGRPELWLMLPID